MKKNPVKIITLDTETYNGLIGKLKRIAIYDGNEVTYGYTLDDVMPVIMRYIAVGYTVHCYIHNMEFDLRKLPSLFEKGNVDWHKCLVINGRIATLDTKYCIYHDSFKLLPSSLAKLSADFEVDHAKLSLMEEVENKYGKGTYKDIVDYLDRCDVDDELYLRYLGYDVISLYEVLVKLRHLLQMSEEEFVKKPSTASISRSVFKNGIGNVVFKDRHTTKTDYEMMCSHKWRTKKDRQIEEFIRLAYCGGRCEVFYPQLKLIEGQEHGYHYDVNSLYPYVMWLNEYPIGKPIYTEETTKAWSYFKLWQENHEGMGFINCQVYIPPQDVPPLPVKMGKLTFPCGHVYGTWTYHELQYAIDNCGLVIEEVFALCHFVQTYPVFKRFIDHFYKLKEQATIDKKESVRTFAKLIQNTGYGYTGMSRDKSQLDDIDMYMQLKSKGKNIKNVNPQYGYLEMEKEMNSEYIQVQIAAYVTSFARLEWLKGARKILSKGGHVYYGDTDSMVTDVPLDDADVDKTRLGAWDLEGKPIKGIFLKPKVYVEYLGTKDDKPLYNTKFKGVSKNMQVINKEGDYQNLNYQYYVDIYDAILNGDTEMVIEKNRMMLRGILYMAKKDLDYETYHEYRDKKMYLQQQDKRNIDYVNNTSTPLYFDTIEKFENFSYTNITPSVDFDYTKGGHE